MALNFTDSHIKKLSPRDKPYNETEDSGLTVRVHPSGSKSWVFIYRKDGKQKWIALGRYPGMKLTEAREKRLEMRSMLDRGIDPQEAEQAAKLERVKAPTVADLVDEYMTKHAKPRKKSWAEDQRVFKKDIIPAWGSRKAKDITKRDVILLLESIFERGSPIASNNTLEKVRKMFAFAVERDILKHNPCAGVKPLGKRTAKDRYLSEDEIKAFWQELDNAPMTDEIRRALRLILITGQRPGEVIGMSFAEIDGDWWTIPAERSKNGKAHRVYLTGMARELIQSGEGLVFESPKKGKAIHVNALAYAVRRAFAAKCFSVVPFTPHDLRRTAATHMASLGYGLYVPKVLNHTDRSVTAIYDRYAYDAEKRKALEAWGRKLYGLITGTGKAKVVPLKR